MVYMFMYSYCLFSAGMCFIYISMLSPLLSLNSIKCQYFMSVSAPVSSRQIPPHAQDDESDICERHEWSTCFTELQISLPVYKSLNSSGLVRSA